MFTKRYSLIIFRIGWSLTGVSRSEDSCALEVTRLKSLSMRLIVHIEGPASMTLISVRQIATLSSLEGSTIHLSLARKGPADPVQSTLIVGVLEIWFRNTPLQCGKPPSLRSTRALIGAEIAHRYINPSHSC